jgi:SAM-dependent methyltransferase
LIAAASPTPVPTPISFTVLPGIPDPTPDWLVALAIAGSVVALIAAGMLIYRGTQTRAMLSPAYLFFAYYVLFVFIGVAWLIADRGNGSYLHFSGTRNYTLLFTTAAGILCFAGGVLVANRQAGFRPIRELERKVKSGWLDRRPGAVHKLLFWVLAAASLATCVILLVLGPVSPLVYLLSHLGQHSLGLDYALDYVRLSFLSTHAGALPFQATLYQFYGNFLPLLGLLAAGWGAVFHNRRWLLVGAALLAVTMLMAAMTLTKNPVENLLVLLFVAWLAFRMRNVRTVEAVVIVALGLVAFFSEVYVTNRGVDLLAVMQGAVRRLFVVQASVLYATFEVFPAQMGFLQGGGVWKDIVNLKPGPKSTLDYGGWLYTVIVTNRPGLGGVGSAPTAFFGQLYADFGVPGALIGMAAVGYAAQWVHIWYVRSPRTVVNWCVYAGLCASIPRLATSGLIAIVFQYGVIASILFGIYMTYGPRLLGRVGIKNSPAPEPGERPPVEYEPARYWRELLSTSFNLTGVGLVGKSQAFNNWGYRARRSAARSLVPEACELRVLDVGSGTGHWVAFWHTLGAARVAGVDLTAVSVRNLRQRFPEDRFEEADITNSVPIEGPFELISAMDVLLHVVDEAGFHRALTNLRSVAAAGSRLLILEPLTFGRPRPMAPGAHSRTRSLAEVTSALESSGWRLEKVRPATWLLSNPVEMQPRAGFIGFQLVWSVVSLAARWEPTGQLVGALLYPIDRLLCRLPWGPSSKVALAVAV